MPWPSLREYYKFIIKFGSVLNLIDAYSQLTFQCSFHSPLVSFQSLYIYETVIIYVLGCWKFLLT